MPELFEYGDAYIAELEAQRTKAKMASTAAGAGRNKRKRQLKGQTLKQTQPWGS